MDDYTPNTPIRKKAMWRHILLLIVATSLAGIYSLTCKRQLEFMGGLAEDNFLLGWELAETGRFYPEQDVPFVLRDPGYPFFIAAVLKLTGSSPPRIPGADWSDVENRIRASFRVVYAAQLVLLVISTVILYLWLVKKIAPLNAFFVALLFGICPYMQILTGLLHYDILHICFTLIALIALHAYVANSGRHGRKILLASGVLWGIVTLIRPMTLILPVFVLAALWITRRPGPKRLSGEIALFVAGMALVIGPYSIRNYAITGRLIAVSAQSGQALGAAVVEKIEHKPNYYVYWDVWFRHGVPIYQKLTGNPAYDYQDLIRNNVILEQAFREEVFGLIRNRPFYYLGNFVYNAFEKTKAWCFLINSVFIKVFQAIQDPRVEVNKQWFVTGNPQDFYSSTASHAFELFLFFLTCCGMAGIAGAIRRRDRFIAAALAAYACLGVAHVITVFGLMHYYIKVPFVFMFYGYSLSLIDRRIRMPFTTQGISMATLLNAAVCIWGIGIAVYIMGA